MKNEMNSVLNGLNTDEKLHSFEPMKAKSPTLLGYINFVIPYCLKRLNKKGKEQFQPTHPPAVMLPLGGKHCRPGGGVTILYIYCLCRS